MKNSFLQLYSRPKPIIGMVHLGDLSTESMEKLITMAVYDIRALQKGGIDGILLENWHEKSMSPFVSPFMAHRLQIVISELVREIKVPFGINILNNDYVTAFSLAKITKADFVQLDVFVDRVCSDFTYNVYVKAHPLQISVDVGDVWRVARARGAANLPLIAFVQPKHYRMLDVDKPIEKSVREAIRAHASAVIITKATGVAPTRTLLQKAKLSAGQMPVGIGSGFAMGNARQYMPLVDFAIVGTSIKKDGILYNPVDRDRVQKLMAVVRCVS